jgi:hypothetical protein
MLGGKQRSGDMVQSAMEAKEGLRRDIERWRGDLGASPWARGTGVETAVREWIAAAEKLIAELERSGA